MKKIVITILGSVIIFIIQNVHADGYASFEFHNGFGDVQDELGIRDHVAEDPEGNIYKISGEVKLLNAGGFSIGYIYNISKYFDIDSSIGFIIGGSWEESKYSKGPAPTFLGGMARVSASIRGLKSNGTEFCTFRGILLISKG